MPKVRFNLKDDGGLILLKFRYRRNTLPLTYSFNRHCPRQFWDAKAGRAKSSKHFPQHSDLNRYLNRLESETLAAYDSLLANGNQPTEKALRAHLDEVTFKSAPAKMTLLKFIGEIIEEKERNPRERVRNTIDNYKGLRKVLRRYDAKLDFSDIDFRWLKDFEQWCYGEGYSRSTVGKFVALTKATVNKARKQKLTDNIEVKEHGFSVSAAKANKMALYLDELDKIGSIEWNQVGTFEGVTCERLEKVADLLLAGCWCGLRHSDLHKLRKHHIKRHMSSEFVEVWTKKKDVLVAIPLIKPLRAVLEKRNYQLPYASRSEIFRMGRLVLKLAGIDSPFQWRDTKGGGLSIQTLPKWEKFSSHVMRRTFATNMLLLGMPAQKVRLITGHSTEKALLDYANFGAWMGTSKMGEIQKWRERLGFDPPLPKTLTA